MNDSTQPTTRREFIKTTGRIAAASAFAGMTVPFVHAQGGDTLQVALVGCGGRGTGAAANAMGVGSGPVKLVAMADVFQNRLDTSYDSLMQHFSQNMEVTQDRKHIGFDAYRHAMDALKPGDIVILTTPLAFRWVHYTYAIQKGLNVFMEKPLCADGPSARKLLALADEASKKNLKCAVGLMSRHARPLQELQQRIQNGEIGDVILLRGYRMSGPLGSAFSGKWPGDPSELLWQIKRFHSFIWASGGCFNDFYIHHIDHLCWMKNAWPVKCQALGGRHYRGNAVDQNFDSYNVEYTFADGAKMYMDGRCVAGCNDIYSSYAHGSKGMAIVAASGDCEPPSTIYSGQKPQRDKLVWQSQHKPDDRGPYDNEWDDLVAAIRNDKPYNEVPRGVHATVACNMGRMAAHTGQEITFDEMLNHQDVYAPGIEDWTMDSPPPLKSDANGKYPVPEPGIVIHHEYAMS
jgi:predicted dehydrogenase